MCDVRLLDSMDVQLTVVGTVVAADSVGAVAPLGAGICTDECIRVTRGRGSEKKKEG
jgi:hypothetical protein